MKALFLLPCLLAASVGAAQSAVSASGRGFAYVAGPSQVSSSDVSGTFSQPKTLTTSLTVHRFLSVVGTFNAEWQVTGSGGGVSSVDQGTTLLSILHCGNVYAYSTPILYPSSSPATPNGSPNPNLPTSLPMKVWKTERAPYGDAGGSDEVLLALPGAISFVCWQSIDSGVTEVSLRRQVTVSALKEPGTYTSRCQLTIGLL